MANFAALCVIAEPSSRRDSLVEGLGKEGYVINVADTVAAGLDCVRRNQPQVVLCDWKVGPTSGLEACRMLRADALTADVNIILIATHYDSDACAACLAAGGDDLFGRERSFDELISRIRVGIRMYNLQMELKHAAITDGLTGLYNHSHFINVIESEFARSRRYGSRLSLITLDLDHFKAVNDTYGHQVGNVVLRQIGQVLRNSVREHDTVARCGGEEFAVIAPEASLTSAAELAERLRQRIAETIRPDQMRGDGVTASFGVASDEDSHVSTSSTLLEMADQALYAAKRSGRNCVRTTADLAKLASESHGDSPEVEQLRRQVASLSVQAKEAYVQSIWSLVQALEARDKYTARHSQNVKEFSERIAAQMDLSPALVQSIGLAAMLHDIGKIGVPDSILLKPGSLTEEERAALRTVPQLSASIVDNMRILQAELPMIRHQHEYFDGSGYPTGLAGDQIPIGARILLVAEAFDSLTTDRVFRPSRSISDAMDEIRRHAGTQFDPRIVDALSDCIRDHRSAIEDCIASSRKAMKATANSAFANLMEE